MEKYHFSEEQRSALESLQMPFAVYQFIDKRVVTVLLSDGFCELFGYNDRDAAVYDMDHDMYKDTHPDDAARIADEAYRFAVEGGSYEVIYRTKKKGSSEYMIIHALGRHVNAENGMRLAHVWYTAEGNYSAGSGMRGSQLNQAMTSALQEESLIRANSYDDLTGLPKMTYFFELAEAGRCSMLEEGLEPVLLFVDLSGLKFFNQKYGFTEGNRILKEFAKILARTFSNENCGRFGQDHFAVFTKEEGIGGVLESFFDKCEKMNGGNSLPVRVGIYPNRMEDVNVSTACDRAKVACDELRGTYISGYRYYDEKLKEEVELRAYILENLDRALEEKWVRVYYQPIIRAVSGKVCDDEALSRWFDPSRGLLSPAEFIPVLEDAGLIYKLDLYVVDTVLEDMRRFADRGFDPVPHSINLSRSDFEACDIVEEIRKRVDASGFGRDRITIEITESTIGRDFDFMKKQIDRFRELGFKVWIDDFGSGYSSLNVLQSLRFDLIKFDMQFMRNFDEGENAKIILNELMKMAASLEVDTVCEGVETLDQVRFLKEIGCSKLQGFYFRAPGSPEQILERYEKQASPIGYEDAKESLYFDAIGRVNLQDMAAMERSDINERRSLLNGIPMAIMEMRNDRIRYVRINRSYRRFMERQFGYDMPVEEPDFKPGPSGEGSTFMNVLRRCCTDEDRAFFNETMPDGSTIHALFRRIAVDPVTETTAVALAVLSITGADEVTTYESLARVLAADYNNIFYVETATGHYVEYSSPEGAEELSLERHGEDFFYDVRNDTRQRIWPEDRRLLAIDFTKEKIFAAIEKEGSYSVTLRLIGANGPVYANMNIVPNHAHGTHLIVGIRNVDTEMKQRAAYENIRREQVVFSRITALAGEFIGLYAVDPKTDHYIKYRASEEFEQYGLPDEGEDFFRQSRIDARQVLCPDDLALYMRFFSRENVMREIEENGIFVLSYSIILNGIRTPVCLRIAKVQESDGEKLIVGLNRSNEQMLQETRGRELHSMEAAPAEKKAIDYSAFVNCVEMPCCVMSVEKKGEDGYGMIRIITANHAYKRAMGPTYYDNMPYYELVPQDNKFEDFCYRSAILGQRMHAYVETRALGCWIDQTLIPLESDREDMGYCQFIFEVTREADAERMASVSAENAEKIIKASIRLLGADDLRMSVGDVLEDIMNASGATGARVMLVDHENEEAVIFSDRMKAEAWPLRTDDPGEDVITYDIINTWKDAIGVSNCLIIKNEADMYEVEKKAPIWVMSMRQNGVKTLILIPLRNRKELIGYLYVVNFDPEKEVKVKELLELLAFYLGTEIFNHLLLQRLERISEVDALTGVNNRRAMSKFVERLLKKAGADPFGVIGIDLNGLKTVNDRDGHDAGDRLLIRAAGLLRRAFRRDDIFRTGGDEFLVLADGLGKELFAEKLQRLRDLEGRDQEVSFAMGAFWSDGKTDVNSAIRIADDRMYEDKKMYYEMHPEKKR